MLKTCESNEIFRMRACRADISYFIDKIRSDSANARLHFPIKLGYP